MSGGTVMGGENSDGEERTEGTVMSCVGLGHI